MKYRAQRSPSDRQVDITSDVWRVRAKLRNVSSTGARVILERQLAVGSQISIGVLQTQWLATVVWRRGPEAGVKFATPLSAQEVTALQSRGAMSQRGAQTHRARFTNHGFRELR